MRRRLRLLAPLLPVLAAAAVAHAAPADDARRLLALLAGIRDEYREAFDGAGRLVRPIELDEARLLLAEARDTAARTAAGVGDGLDALGGDLDARVPADAFATRVETLRRAVTQATGVAEDTAPPAPPSAARGAALFAENCVPCHGARGAGDGSEAARLGLRPANFTDPAFVGGETPQDFFSVITLGRRRSGMPAWGDVFSVQERWDLVSHVWSLHTAAPALAEGQGVWLAQCAGCHGATADGRGPLAATVLGRVPDLSTPAALAEQSDTELAAIVAAGVPGTPMPAYDRILAAPARANVVAWLRAVSLGAGAPEVAPAAAPHVAPDVAAGFAEVHHTLEAALDAARRHDPEASALATDAYMRFEPFEKRLGATHPARVRAVEEGFLALRTAIRAGVASGQVDALAATLRAELDAAEHELAPHVGGWPLFMQSAAIILREGFEIVLVVGALAAYVRRSGQAKLIAAIRGGTILGVVASLATAALLSTLLRMMPWASDALEGVAMLVAAVVLFFVSYWIISKAEAERWQRYIRAKAERALSTGSGVALAAAAFLAVYREGFETVLFYQALLGGAPAGDLTVVGGFVCGLGLLAVAWFLFDRFGKRLPIRQFFLATGAFLYCMAIVFAGRGVHELQESQVVGVTPVPAVPAIDVLGLFPTLETLLAQGVLVALLVYATARTLRRPPADVDAVPLRKAAGA